MLTYVNTDIFVLCATEVIGICGISMAFGGIFVVGTYMVMAW